MKITSITVGKSVQVFQIGQPEYWDKFSITAELDEADNDAEQAADKLHGFIDGWLKKHLPEQPVYKPVPSQKETIADLKKELDVRNK